MPIFMSMLRDIGTRTGSLVQPFLEADTISSKGYATRANGDAVIL
jgi:hypothetical protein